MPTTNAREASTAVAAAPDIITTDATPVCPPVMLYDYDRIAEAVNARIRRLEHPDSPETGSRVALGQHTVFLTSAKATAAYHVFGRMLQSHSVAGTRKHHLLHRVRRS